MNNPAGEGHYGTALCVMMTENWKKSSGVVMRRLMAFLSASSNFRLAAKLEKGCTS
jgi:hypothetical protein